MSIRLYAFACVILLVFLSITAEEAVAQELASLLVNVEHGDLPIILSAPHGGREAIPNVAPRQGNGVSMFKTMSDVNTDLLAVRLADAIEERCGKRPYLVIARFHRKYADANRPSQDAYEAPEAQAVYDSYHQALAEARSQVIERWGRGVLFDIHGQAADPNAIFRGTQNGKTTAHLVDRFGLNALTGETSVFGQFQRQGISVIPEVGSANPEHPSYNGGYTVRHYGSGNGGSLDAIQLELGRNLRASSEVPATAAKLTNAILAFAREYLPETERDAQPHKHKAVQVAVYIDTGVGKSSKKLLATLERFDGVQVRTLTADEIRSGSLAECDVLIHPGGSGGAQGRHLGESGREAVRTFISEGGGFIGVCAGAYLASADYTWSLHVLDAKVLDRQHWARGNGTVTISLTDAGQRIFDSSSQEFDIYYGQGPLLAPAGDPDIADYEPIATYTTEIAKNGAPSGVMQGTTAIASGSFGQGRVFCFSPHPELTDGLEPLIHEAIEAVTQRDSVQSPSK